MIVQKTICWPNLGCALQHGVRHCRSRIHSEARTGSSCSAMTQHYPTTSAAAALWASGPSFPVCSLLLNYTYSLLPARALSKTLLFVSTKAKSTVKVLDDPATCGRVMTTV